LEGEPWVEGIAMVLQKLRSFMENQAVTPIEAVGQPFDPTLHEAIMQVETDEQPDGAVLDELQRGYKLGERVLRPSMVRVASNPNDK
jgi:molecular chaperone GrpE